jgi:cyclopropane-fatty-acyl-phospholipid synthase
MLLERLRRFIRVGLLELVFPDGRLVQVGEHGGDAPVRVRVLRRSSLLRLALAPELALGEAYVNGDLIMERGDIYSLLRLLGRNFTFDRRRRRRRGWFGRLPLFLHRLLHYWNDRRTARRNLHLHYDRGVEFFRLWLDKEMHYSCAYFPTPETDLEAAQAAKAELIAAKLHLRPGQRVLDIGCGFGALARALAHREQVSVTGVSLSPGPLAEAAARARTSGLDNALMFRNQDYRDVDGQFDRVVSVGMLEHVGLHHYQVFFDQVSRLMTADGVALIHCIGRRDPPGVTNPWVRRYIFPGGYIPALSEILPCVERAGLWVTDVEILRLHYAMTLWHWRRRFEAAGSRIEEMFDARFRRMWEFYLAASEISFRDGGHMVFQLQLAKQPDAVPLTRAYLRGAL